MIPMDNNPPTFKTIPDEEELSSVERDMRFHPSETTSPSVLSPEQIESFNERGYLKSLPVFERDEISNIRSYFDDLLAKSGSGRWG